MKNDDYLKSIGAKMRKIRMNKKVSITEMHRITGIAESNITHVEKWGRNVHILTLKAIADVLDVDVKDFL
jgi:DNA-binding Xre family transcriptional regulator